MIVTLGASSLPISTVHPRWGSSASATLNKEWIRGENKHEIQLLFSRKSVVMYLVGNFPFLFVLGVDGSNNLAI